jgi:hypothetical protein
MSKKYWQFLNLTRSEIPRQKCPDEPRVKITGILGIFHLLDVSEENFMKSCNRLLFSALSSAPLDSKVYL